MQISETHIESTINKINHEVVKIEDFIQILRTDSSDFWEYLEVEYFPLLSQKERELLLFILFVIHESIQSSDIFFEKISLDTFQDLEEKNWGILETRKSGQFRERLNPFFDQYQEEDLLAFVEDMLSIDENDEVSSIGREPILIATKTYIDCFFMPE